MSNLNVTSTALEKGIDLIKEFLSPLITKPLNEVGELFSDTIKVWRVKNQIRNIEKVKAIVEKEGITTKAINMKVLFPYLDAVALEDDETLQDMWSNLFVNYIDSEKNLTTHVYPEILRQLSSTEIKIIQSTRLGYRRIYKNSTLEDSTYYSEVEILNLARLGIMEEIITLEDNKRQLSHIHRRNDNNVSDLNFTYKRTGYYRITEFGISFLEACTREPN